RSGACDFPQRKISIRFRGRVPYSRSSSSLCSARTQPTTTLPLSGTVPTSCIKLCACHPTPNYLIQCQRIYSSPRACYIRDRSSPVQLASHHLTDIDIACLFALALDLATAWQHKHAFPRAPISMLCLDLTTPGVVSVCDAPFPFYPGHGGISW